MNKKHGGHAHDHQHKHPQHHNDASPRFSLHKDWRAWVAVLLMLGAMVAYLATMEESVVPGEPLQEQVPAAEAP